MTMQHLSKQRGMSIIGMLLLLVVLGFIAIVLMKVVPMYLNYNTVRSTVEGLRKESNITQMSPSEIYTSLQKRFDIGYVNSVKATDLKIRNDAATKGRVVDLIYNDEQELFYGLYVVLKVNDVIPLTPK